MNRKDLLYTGFFILVLFSAGLYSCGGAQAIDEPDLADTPIPAIIPLPAAIEWGDNFYRLPEQNVICYDPENGAAAQWLEELLVNAGVRVESRNGNTCGNWTLVTDNSLKEQLGEEGYLLDIKGEGVTLKSATPAGLFYGIQTLRQMFPPEIENSQLSNNPVYLREVQIEDKPHFSWRGTMVDIARSFFGPEYLKEHIDRMALYKLNRLHLHLTDDQGWRIEIKSKPKLTETGSKGAVDSGVSGFLSQEEYRDLQNYALARNIVIIPEVDLPGHIYAALVAYPELNCDDYTNLTPARSTPPQLYSGHEVGWSKLCLEKPEVYEFVAEVIGELAEITTGPWIHLGGDEIDDPLYEEFITKADSIVQLTGKTSIGWEEVTKANVSASLISQQWHGKVESTREVKIIQSLCSNFYLDHANVPGQENTNNWCKVSGVSLEDVYSFTNSNPNVLGVEAPVWTEFVYSEETLDNRFWPRILAVAEVAWTAEEQREISDFKRRIGFHSRRLNKMGINYFLTPGIDWEPSVTKVESRRNLFSGFLPDLQINNNIHLNE